MQTDHSPHQRGAARQQERGAALVTTLLLTTLLLLAGGALIIKTSSAVGGAYDASTEVEAYYAAEAGLQAALNVLRGNHENAAGDKATFRNAVLLGNARLDAWITNYNGNNVVPIGTDGYGYRLSIDDPDDTDLSVAGVEPDRLDIVSVGFGSRGSRRELRIRLKNSGNIDIPGAVTLRGNTAGTGGMSLDLGNSSGREFLTDATDPKPVFVVTNGADSAEVTTEMDDDQKNNGADKATYGNPPLANTSVAGSGAELPEFLSTPADTASFIDDMKAADEPNDNIYIYEGDHTFTGNGSGILVVTGTLTLHGTFSWDGIIFVLGDGVLEWKGGGNVDQGNINGAIFVAKYDPNDLAAGFGNPSFTVKGGGKSTLSYNRNSAQSALTLLGFRIVGVQEQ